MKKIICLFMSIVVIISVFVACSKNDTNISENLTTTTTSTTSTTTTTETITETTIQQLKISSNCDKVLASGYDKDGNEYELVANETEDYSGIKVEIGVIKNNEWLTNLTNNFPFIGEYGCLKAYKPDNAITGSIYDAEFANFYYVGNGCFYYDETIYNCETKKTSDEVLKNLPYYYFCLTTGGDDCIVNNDGKILFESESNLYCLDTTTMKYNCILEDVYGYKVFALSEGLFACVDYYSSPSDRNGFYNQNGKKIISLTEFDMGDSYNCFSISGSQDMPRLVFEEGKCTFKVTNQTGTEYEITIDKQGEILNQIELY